MERGTCKLGVYVKDIVNGSEGLVVGKVIWMFGCEKLIVSPKEINNNQLVFDSYRVRHIVSEEYVELTGEPSTFERDFIAPDTDIFFGKKVRDKVTGWEGICIACQTTLFNSDQYAVEKLNKKGRPENEWFDEARLEIVGEGIKADDVKSPTPGGSEISLPHYVLPAMA